MRRSSSLVAPSAVALLSTALLCSLAGAAMSQTTPNSTLPGVTIEAPKQGSRVATPSQGRSHAANGTARPTSPIPQTPTAEKPASGSVMARIAAIEKTSGNCKDGCQTSFKYGSQPWNGCSSPGSAVFSTTCRNPPNFKTYNECRETGMFVSWGPSEMWWYCSSLHAAGKLSGEKHEQVAELKRPGHR